MDLHKFDSDSDSDLDQCQSQTGGGILSSIWKLFLALLVIVLVIVCIVFVIAYLSITFLKGNRITGGLISLLCGFTTNAYIVLLSGILELITSFIPPVGIVAIPILKIIDTYGTVCELLSPNTNFVTTILGLVSLLPIGGAFGKFAKFYMKL